MDDFFTIDGLNGIYDPLPHYPALWGCLVVTHEIQPNTKLICDFQGKKWPNGADIADDWQTLR